jgi:hypothetical protein
MYLVAALNNFLVVSVFTLPVPMNVFSIFKFFVFPVFTLLNFSANLASYSLAAFKDLRVDCENFEILDIKSLTRSPSTLWA